VVPLLQELIHSHSQKAAIIYIYFDYYSFL